MTKEEYLELCSKCYDELDAFPQAITTHDYYHALSSQFFQDGLSKI
ncbi:hypothetical protein [uncultured Dysgonomonas sp.]|nr:hypothetical protein [uncultured Dysgonomonas sp.]